MAWPSGARGLLLTADGAALESYFDFVDYQGGSIAAERIPGQAAMALRMAGFENMRILHGGFGEWKARGGMDAHARAGK